MKFYEYNLLNEIFKWNFLNEIRWGNFLNKEIWTLKLICLIMQQKLILKMWHTLISSFALKANVANLKTEVNKLDIDKLVPVPVDLSKLSDVVKNDVVKKTVSDKLVEKVNNINTSDFVLKTKYDTDKSELESKIPNVTHFVKNANLTELENKIPDISNFATKAALTTVKNKIPDVSSLV